MRIEWGIYPPALPMAVYKLTELLFQMSHCWEVLLSCPALQWWALASSECFLPCPALQWLALGSTARSPPIPSAGLGVVTVIPKCLIITHLFPPGILRCIEWWPQSDMSTSKPQTETATITIFGRKKKIFAGMIQLRTLKWRDNC